MPHRRPAQQTVIRIANGVSHSFWYTERPFTVLVCTIGNTELVTVTIQCHRLLWAGDQVQPSPSPVQDTQSSRIDTAWPEWIQCYTVGKSQGSITGPIHRDGLLGLRHEPGGLKTSPCSKPAPAQNTGLRTTAHAGVYPPRANRGPKTAQARGQAQPAHTTPAHTTARETSDMNRTPRTAYVRIPVV